MMKAWDRQLALQLARTCMWLRWHLEPGAAAPGKPEPSRLAILEDGKGPQAISLLHDEEATPAAYACILGYPSSVVVAFQWAIAEPGPDGKLSVDAVKEWLHGFRAELKGTGATGLPGRVHEAVHRKLSSMASELRAQLREALSLRPGCPLLVTGHGQGGALAAIASKWLDLQGLPPAATCTFGAPRPGDAKLASSVKTPVYRCELGDDIMPHVPPRTAVAGVIGGLARVGGFLGLAPHDELLRQLGQIACRAQASSYAGVGALCYRDRGAALRPGLGTVEEEALAARRAKALLVAGKDMLEHHEMESYLEMLEA